MVNLLSKLKRWSEEFLEGSDEFLVDVVNKPGSTKYRVLVDGLEGITIKRCAQISRYISKQMEEDNEIDEDEFFTFEVSSPGADRPLKLPKQYFKHVGRTLSVETLDGNKYEGKLNRADETSLDLEIEISKKEHQEMLIKMEDIKEANVIISFK